MNIINIVLVVIIVYILYNLSFDKKKAATLTAPMDKSKVVKYNKKSFHDNLINDIVSLDDSYDSYDSIVVKKRELNPNFLNNQFHNDYRDVITGLNNLVPDKKQLFNLPNIPLHYSEPEFSEVKYMVKDFLTVLNLNIDTEVPAHRSVNSGWDEAIPDPNMKKSGWEKIQESLGLPTSLYEKPAKQSKIVLVAINMVQKYETEDEIKYVCVLVLQKLNVEDQMIIKASFVQDKRPMNDENMFFKKDPIQMKVHIESIFIVGYLSKYGDDAKRQFANDGDDVKYMDYDKMEYNQLTDPKEINKLLMAKYQQKAQEMEARTSMLDSEGKLFHKTLPHIFNYSKHTGAGYNQYNNIMGTKTLFPKT